MIYVAVAILILLVAVLLMRVRIRLEQSVHRGTLFFGLGRSGLLFDFRVRQLSLRLFGLRLKSFSLRPRTPEPSAPQAPPSQTGAPQAGRTVSRATVKRRRRLPALGDLWQLLSRSAGAFADFFFGLLADAIVEQADGEVVAGFESPHLTGQIYGCYQAALAIAPSVVGRIGFVPVWTGPTFDGSFRLAVAWPVYRLGWRAIKLVVRLPIRTIVRMAISSREGKER